VATKLFLRNTASDIDPGGAGEEALLAALTAGSGLSTGTTDTIGSATTQITVTRDTASDIEMVWYTNPLSSVAISGAVTFNVWMSENNMSANVQASCIIERVSNTGAFINTLQTTSNIGSELPVTTRAAQNWAVGGVSGPATLNDGDRIRLIVGGLNIGTMAAGFTFNIGFSGATAAADGDSWVQFTETIVEQPTFQPRPSAVNITTSPGVLMEKRNWLWLPKRPKLWRPELWTPPVRQPIPAII
jgi:hypothetical protein